MLTLVEQRFKSVFAFITTRKYPHRMSCEDIFIEDHLHGNAPISIQLTETGALHFLLYCWISRCVCRIYNQAPSVSMVSVRVLNRR